MVKAAGVGAEIVNLGGTARAVLLLRLLRLQRLPRQGAGRLGVGGGDGSVDQGTHHRGMYEMDTHVCVQAFHSSTLSHIVVRTTPMK